MNVCLHVNNYSEGLSEGEVPKLPPSSDEDEDDDNDDGYREENANEVCMYDG